LMHERIRRKARKRLNTEFTENGAQRSQRQLGRASGARRRIFRRSGGRGAGGAGNWRMPRCLLPQPPISFHEGMEVAGRLCKGVSHFRGESWVDLREITPSCFELAKLRGEDFFGDAGEKVAKFCEALRLEREIPKRENFPFADMTFSRGFNGTAVMFASCELRVSKDQTNPLQRGLQKLCVLGRLMGV